MQQQTTLPPRPVAPAQPDAYRRLVRDLDQARRNLSRARAGSIVHETILLKDALDAERAVKDWLATPEGVEFTRAVRAYNEAVLEYRRAKQAAEQAEQNNQERQAIRAAMCQKCWTVHRPEVECD